MEPKPSLIFFEKQTHLSQNWWQQFFQQGINQFLKKLVKTYGNFICYFWFLATQIYSVENAKNCFSVWLVLTIYFVFFSNQRAEVLTFILNWLFCSCNASKINCILGNDSNIGNFEDQNAQQVPKFFGFSWESNFNDLQNYWLHFVHQCIDRQFSAGKKLLDWQTM